MWQELLHNKKITGSILVGLALVGSAYLSANFGQGRATGAKKPIAVVTKAEPRPYIGTLDSNGDGIEDWREEFTSNSPVVTINNISEESPLIRPDFEAKTLTDQLSVNFFESIMQARGTGQGAQVITPSLESVINQTTNRVQNLARDSIYNTSDIVVTNTSNETIRDYGNTMGRIIITNNIPGNEDELMIIKRVVDTNNPDGLKDLKQISEMYRTLRDESLKTPVPDKFIKQHLDTINTYNALFHTLDEMGLVLEDPVVALMRIKRYQDDAAGLAIALRNMYNTLLPHAALFSLSDPVTVFIAFSERK